MKGDSSYAIKYKNAHRTPVEKDTDVYRDDSVPLYVPKGLHSNCKGCNNIIEKNNCKYFKEPRLKKFPCYLREANDGTL